MKVSSTGNTGQDVFINAFNPVLRFLQCSGYYLGRENTTFRNLGLMLLTCIYRLAVLYNLFRYAGIFIGATDFDGSLTSALAVFTFYCYIAYISLALTFSLPRNMGELIDLFRAYIKDYGAAPYLMKIRIRMRIFVIISTVLYSTCIITYTVGINNAFPSVRRHMAPFNKSGEYAVIYLVCYILLLIIVSSHVISAFVTFHSVAIILFNEFGILTKKLQEDIETNFDQFCQRHGRLCKIITTANNIQTHIVSATYGFGIPMLCFLSFGLIKGSLPLDELLFCSGNLLTILLLMVDVTCLSCAINAKAHEPLQHIFYSSWTTFSEMTLHKMSLFVGRVSSEKIGYSVYGLFTVDRSTILMLVGTVVTYVVVVLQFQTGSGQGCQYECPSLTTLNLTKLCS